MKYKIVIHNEVIIEANDEDEARDEIIMNYEVDKHDLDIQELEEELNTKESRQAWVKQAIG